MAATSLAARLEMVSQIWMMFLQSEKVPNRLYLARMSWTWTMLEEFLRILVTNSEPDGKGVKILF